MSAPARGRPALHFAGVVIEGTPDGGTPQQARELIAERLARHVSLTVERGHDPRRRKELDALVLELTGAAD